jgi:IS4 transposase
VQQVYILVKHEGKEDNMGRSRNLVGTKARNWGSADLEQLMRAFQPWLDIATGLGKPVRERLFSPARVFWLFLSQVLSPDGSCQETLQKFLAWLALTEGKEASPNTAAYCKARARLPMKAVERVRDEVARRIQQSPLAQDRWHGRHVKVVDGSGLSMPDTPENQAKYPQSKKRKAGCGFPEMRMVAMFSLATGVLLHCAQASRYISERALFRHLWAYFEPGDVALADRGFCGFAEYFFLLQRGVDSVMRLHQRRSAGVRIVKQLGPGDTLVQWIKMKPCPKWLTQEQWAAVPSVLDVRHVAFTVDIPGFRSRNITIATTLTHHRKFPPSAIAELYRRRWRIELYLRDIKISLGMDILRCRTPRMVEKELAMHVIAYNLIRATMLQAAHAAQRELDRISFKGTCQTLRQWAPILAIAPPHQFQEIHTAMLSAIARAPLPSRPNRYEPRARKRSPKNYQLLNKPRHVFKEIQNRNRYAKMP